MNVRRREEVIATHEAWFKHVPEMAAKLGDPPAKRTQRYRRAAALAKCVEHLTPPPFDRAAMLDPFGTLLDRALGLRFFGGKPYADLKATIDDFDPTDPMRACSKAFEEVCGAISSFGSTVRVIDESERIRAEDLGLPPPQTMTAHTEIEGYNVDVKALRAGCRQLLEIEESLETIDIRRRAVRAVRLFVQACLFSVMEHLTERHQGQIFRFEFNKDDPTRYRHTHKVVDAL